MRKTSTHGTIVETSNAAGIDIGKDWLDVALAAGEARLRTPNCAKGHADVIAFLRRHGICRVGMEATGGYERKLLVALSDAGFKTVVFQPRQVRAYATFRLNRAKNDRIDAKLIASCTAAAAPQEARDVRLLPLAEHLMVIEQIEEDLARARVRREHLSEPRLIALQAAEIARLKSLRKAELERLNEDVLAHPDLARRFELLISIDGIGARTALALIIHMPELGSLTREQAAALLGVAPYVRESGRHKSDRHVAGGRARPRKSLYAAAQAACRRWNRELIAHYDRLTKAGKPHRLAVVACTRKLIVFANTVLARGTPWQTAR
jgi:transposase